ncbi:PTS lactose/cellobiose transporter subunit IIC family protein [Lysinibacillus sphaericus]|uniref:PTS system lactose/cellobiose transporter subunit IIC family protein n=1 Tax=Lysinibacillus sphaericus OT4b.31 TaxID=1285586 RepID=R7Z816_LYSSH|nr:PTS lactose/cellobiose transporter subunit IIC family protein [Lysinibacillus sphaericus]EON70253.1 PTS system lactose/cellobiose transporter subunit IIC family protein [Lysinibacillus sphaericus OT4b.31]
MDFFHVTLQKITDNRYLIAIRNSFTMLIPLILVGSMASLINNFPIMGIQNLINETFLGQLLKSVNGTIWNASI